MPRRIELTRAALADFNDIYDYIARDNPPAAAQCFAHSMSRFNSAVRHCSETWAYPDDFVHARLFDDMAPFHFQIDAAWHHSVWGLEAVKTGVFAPPALVGPVPFADLQAMIGKAGTALKAFIPDEVNSY